MKIANPIYDVVFKYLMEDERIACTILSVLLKKDVVKVDMRAHEYSNDEREDEDNGMGISGHSCDKYTTDGWGGYTHYHFDYLNDGENYATLEINFKSVK